MSNPLTRAVFAIVDLLHEHVTHTWGTAIVVAAIFLRFLALPLTWSLARYRARAEYYRGELEAIAQRFPETDPESKQERARAIMSFLKDKRMNPASGCLVGIVQIVVWWSTYRALNTPLLMGERFLWCPDLTRPDPFYFLPLMTGAAMLVEPPIPSTFPSGESPNMKYLAPILLAFSLSTAPSSAALFIAVDVAMAALLGRILLAFARHAVEASNPAD